MPEPVGELELPLLDYMDPELAGDRFHGTMRGLREAGWLARVRPFGYAILEREAAGFFLRSRSATFPGTQALELLGITDGPIYERLSGNLLDLDGPDHRRLRRLVQPAFTVQAADELRPAMRERLAELYERVTDGGRCEFVAAFAKPYPSLMIATVMGAPLEDADRLHEWAYWIQAQFDAVKLATERPRVERAAVEFDEYTWSLLRRRRDAPGDDLLSRLIAAESEGDRLSERECVDLAGAVLVGGVDTTQSQLAQGIRLFAEHPDQWRLLAEDPSLVPSAVEEVLRYEPITPFTARMTLDEVEYRGVTFPPGTVLLVSALTANHDPAEYSSPERFDIAAERGRGRPLTFGAGLHFCLGANLARAELEEAFLFLSRRFEHLELDGEPSYDTVTGIYGLRELPIRFGFGATAP